MANKKGVWAFFRDELNAPPKNSRWSWGSYQPQLNRLFLLLWEDSVHGDLVAVHNSKYEGSSLGYSERLRHLQYIRAGAETFAALAKGEDTSAHGRRITQYDDENLLVLGEITELPNKPQLSFAKIKGAVSVSEVIKTAIPHSTVSTDLEDLASREDLRDRPTKCLRLIQARIGQGRYRENLLDLWGHKCAITGCSVNEVIRASHIKPWAISSDRERLDAHNGIPLVATLDALFDGGLVTFSNDGEMLISSRLNSKQTSLLGLTGRLRKPLLERQLEYMKFHREKKFRL